MKLLTIIKIILILFYSQQTLMFYWCLMSEKITGIVYTGGLSTFIFICSFLGNMSLGPFKGYIDSKDELDAEIPSDDDEEEDSDEKELKKGLSRRELSMIKSLNK